MHNCIECLNRLETITGRKIEREVLDVTDKAAVSGLFKRHNFFAVLHLAALKAVGESVTMPLEYYRVNVGGTINVLEVSIYYTLRTTLLFIHPNSYVYSHLLCI